MRRPQHSPAPPTSSAPRAPLGDQARHAIEIGEAMQPGIVPALQDHLDRAVFDARQAGQQTLGEIDLSALPGQTLGDQAGQREEEYLQTPLGQMPGHLAEQFERTAKDSLLSSQIGAMEATRDAVSNPDNGFMRTAEAQIRSAPRHRVMVPSHGQERDVYQGSINGVSFSIPFNREVSLPYPIISLLVDNGRIPPPSECPELIASAINAGSLNATAQMAAMTRSNAGGHYMGDSADPGAAAHLEAIARAQLEQQLGRSLPANYRQYTPEPVFMLGGRAA